MQNAEIEVRSAEDVGRAVRRLRIAQGLTQKELAGIAATGERFVIDLERGKDTCRLGMALHVLSMLGARVVLKTPEPLDG